MKDFSGIKSILFDMDGTLIKHTWQYHEITTALFDAFAEKLAPFTGEQFYEVFWSKNFDMWYMMLDGVIDGDTAQVYSYINTLRHLKLDESLAPQMVDVWVQLVLKEAAPFDDTIHVLNTLREKYTLGIVTNGFATMQRAKIQHYNLAQHVDFTMVSEEIGYHKPDPRIFDAALKQAGDISPQQAIFIGDNLQTDIAGALNTGIHPVWIAGNGYTPPDGVTVIERLSDLLPLLMTS